jgi:hypothetical protein
MCLFDAIPKSQWGDLAAGQHERDKVIEFIRGTRARRFDGGRGRLHAG